MEKLPHTIICAITELIQHNAQSDCYGSDHSRWNDLQLISCIKQKGLYVRIILKS